MAKRSRCGPNAVRDGPVFCSVQPYCRVKRTASSAHTLRRRYPVTSERLSIFGSQLVALGGPRGREARKVFEF